MATKTTSHTTPAPAPTEWAPRVRLDLETASRAAFEDIVQALYKTREEQDDLPMPFTLGDEWYDITPQMAEAGLLRSAGNREVNFPHVKNLALQMKTNEWKETGQTIVFNVDGFLNEGRHRLMAAYLSGATFRSYVVTTAPVVKDLFAYYDQGKKRSIADALYTSGTNGLAKVLARAVSAFAVRYDYNALRAMGSQKRISVQITPIYAMKYLEQHPGLKEAAHLMFGSETDAIAAIGDKGVAAFFAWLIVRSYGEDILHSFCGPLGSGANLSEDSPILAVRNRLVEKDMKPPMRLALLCKAFNMTIRSQKMAKSSRTLSIRDNEAFPRIDAQELPVDEAAE